jgi:hypothetical protein
LEVWAVSEQIDWEHERRLVEEKELEKHQWDEAMERQQEDEYWDEVAREDRVGMPIEADD